MVTDEIKQIVAAQREIEKKLGSTFGSENAALHARYRENEAKLGKLYRDRDKAERPEIYRDSPEPSASPAPEAAREHQSSWTETKPRRWERSGTIIRMAKSVGNTLSWTAFFPDGKKYAGDSLDEVKAYADTREGRSVFTAPTPPASSAVSKSGVDGSEPFADERKCEACNGFGTIIIDGGHDA